MTQRDLTGYGLRDEVLTHISDVDRGLACNCVCVACKTPLVARKGASRKHHFAHAAESSCEGGAETALHLLAKELFGEMERLQIPAYTFKREKTLAGSDHVVRFESNTPVARGGSARIDAVSVEVSEGSFIPDIVISSHGKQLIVEIAVTHKVDRHKLRRIRKRNLPAIEIQLERHDALLTRAELKAKLMGHLASKNWLFHPDQRKAEASFLLLMKQSRNAARLKAARQIRMKELLLQNANRLSQAIPAPDMQPAPDPAPVRKPASPERVREYLLRAIAMNLNYSDDTMPLVLRGHYDDLIAAFLLERRRFPSLDECLAMPRLTVGRRFPHL